MGDILFTYFDKISDTILFFSNDITLSICMQLNRKNAKDNKITNFHSEYRYNSKSLNKESYSIKRSIQAYFAINDLKDFKNGVILKPNDVYFLKMLIDSNIIPWFIGNNRLFFIDEKNKLQLKGKYTIQEFKISEYSFLAFAPIVIRYEDGTDKEGIRMLINSRDRFVDITVDTFIAFYYYITNTDLYNAAANMANYVKMTPYDVGLIDMNANGYEDRFNQYGNDDWNAAKKSGRSGDNFFSKF